MKEKTEGPFSPDHYRREDEAPDHYFYSQPRLVVHIDDSAIEAIGEFFAGYLPEAGWILDLMSSWRSHMPERFSGRKLVGLGLNGVEMAENPQLDHRVIHDLNLNPVLPFREASFDAAVVTVSVQYITRPVQLFRQVARVLRAGASFHVIYSNRMFPTKATALWKSLSDADRANLVSAYFRYAGGWEEPETRDISPRPGFYTDPVLVVSARKRDGD